MRRLYTLCILTALTILSLSCLTRPASADPLLDTYIARLSYADHRNSSGQRITTVAGVIRQDRANYHRYSIRDSQDQYDSVFGSEHNRDIMEAKLALGSCSASARRSILNGTPRIVVKVYRSHIDITVLD